MAVRMMSRMMKRFCCVLDISHCSAPPVTLMMRYGCGSFHTSSSSACSCCDTVRFCSLVPSVGKPMRTIFAIFFDVFEKRSSPNAFDGASRVHSSFDFHSLSAGF